MPGDTDAALRGGTMKRTHLLRGKTLYRIEKDTGETQRVWQHGNFYAYEYEALRKDGRKDWYEHRNKQASNSK